MNALINDRSTDESCRVLVIAANDTLLALIRLSLAKDGFEVETAATASDGLEVFGQFAADLVVLDPTMPDLSGWEILRRIREKSGVLVMLVSERSSEVDKARGFDLGADDYVCRPFGLLEFEARVRALLRRARGEMARHRPPAAPLLDGSGLTIAIIAERRHLGNKALREAQADLAVAGCRVDLVVPDVHDIYRLWDDMPPWDAVLSRGRDLAGLGLLAAASALGVVAINTPQSIELVRNKIAMQAVLAKHRLPLPKTWFAASTATFRRMRPECFPLIVKPFDGDGSHGLALLTRPEDVDLLPTPEGCRSLYLAQEYLETDGSDLKLYGVGGQVWAVRKPSPVSFPRPGPAVVHNRDGAEAVPLDSALWDIALTCGRACGLELWGVDVAMTGNGPYVIEVNDFPTYSAVPGAGAAIARHTLTLVHANLLSREARRHRILSMV
ncbi:MAG TPA: response regulator [Chloroflexota bacterium]|nr:response regulator [Chloroflexota bacterium]